MSAEAVEAPGVVAGGICVKAEDTQRVLLICRSDTGEYEFPGGRCDEGEVTLAAAQREWQEETGLNLPPSGRLAGEWTSTDGKYTGYVWLIPSEDGLELNQDDPDIPNPDPGEEECRWFSLDDLPSNLRAEVKLTPWDEIRAATSTLTMAYHPLRRQAALDAYKKHGSIRRAAKAVGVPKSTVHDWVTRAVVKGPTQNVDDEPKPADQQVTDNERNEEAWEDLHADATQDAPSKPGLPSNLNPQNPDLPPTSAVGMGTNTQLEPDVPISADSRAPGLAGGLWTQVDSNPNFLRGFRRWVNLRANGVNPRYALDAVQQIDENWEITQQEQDHVDDALKRMKNEGQFWMAERFVFAGAPAWLGALVNSQRIGDTTALAAAISAIRTPAYLAAINANLHALGLEPVTAITSQELLDQIAKESQDSADDIADTYDNDLENAAGRLHLHAQSQFSPDGASIQATVVAGLAAWASSRLGWKSDQVATSEAADAYNSGMREFQRHNGAATGGYIEADKCACEICCEMVAMGDADNPMPIDDAVGLDTNPHPSCRHALVLTYDGEWDKSRGLPWSGQDQ